MLHLLLQNSAGTAKRNFQSVFIPKYGNLFSQEDLLILALNEKCKISQRQLLENSTPTAFLEKVFHLFNENRRRNFY